jgi:hypothetical protein
MSVLLALLLVASLASPLLFSFPNPENVIAQNVDGRLLYGYTPVLKPFVACWVTDNA